MSRTRSIILDTERLRGEGLTDFAFFVTSEFERAKLASEIGERIWRATDLFAFVFASMGSMKRIMVPGSYRTDND